jgi:hypothetical protein
LLIREQLIETGKALRLANKRGVGATVKEDNRLQLVTASSTERFHLALDELESEIVCRARKDVLVTAGD